MRPAFSCPPLISTARGLYRIRRDGPSLRQQRTSLLMDRRRRFGGALVIVKG
jgi:hypothetical protein